MSVLIKGITNSTKNDIMTYRNSNNRIFHLEKDTEVYTKYMEVSNNNGSLTKDTEVEDKYIITSDGDYYIPHIHTIMKDNKVIDIETTASRPILDDVVIGGSSYTNTKYNLSTSISDYTTAGGFEYKGKYYAIIKNRIIIIDSSNEISDVKTLSNNSAITGVVFINDITYAFNDRASYILDIENFAIQLHRSGLRPSTAHVIYLVFTLNNEIYANIYYGPSSLPFMYKINDSADTITAVSGATVIDNITPILGNSNNIVEYNGFAYSFSVLSTTIYIYKTLDFITFTRVLTISPAKDMGLISLHGILYAFTYYSNTTTALFYTISDDGIATMIFNDYSQHANNYIPSSDTGIRLFTYNDSICLIYNTEINISTNMSVSLSVFNFGVDGYFKKGWKINDIKITEDGFHHLDIDKNIVIEP